MIGTLIFTAIALLGVGALYAAAWLAGKDHSQKQQAQANVEAGKRIADAEANSPRDHDALVDELRRGGQL